MGFFAETTFLVGAERLIGFERGGYFSDGLRRARQETRHGTCVYKVKCFFGKRVSQNVVTPDLKVGCIDSLEKTRLKVGRDNVTTGPHVAAEPLRDGAASTSYFQTIPAFSDAHLLKISYRPESHAASRCDSALWHLSTHCSTGICIPP